jgi:tRNA 2-thiocytidine biosynthesis protein TtcA
LKPGYNKLLLSKVKRTIIKYGMIREGDKIAIGVSGGKDSSALLYILSLVKAHAPFPFFVEAITVDMGWGMDYLPLENYCSNLGIPLTIEKTQIARIVFDTRKEKNPCSLCAKLRRGALHKAAQRLGCNRVALGHHLDDAAETFFMNFLFSGRLETFKPHTYLSRRNLFLIRPLITITQEALSTLARQEGLPILNNPCPVAGKTKREEMGEIVRCLATRYPAFYRRFITSMGKSGNWPESAYIFE